MILDADGVVKQAKEFVGDQTWIGKTADALVDTWNAVPVGTRWSLGMGVVACVALGKFLLPGIATVIRAWRHKD